MATRLIELIEHLPKSRVVLVGDFMVDRYIFGSTDRVSPEAPIPVLRYTREEYRLGGAGFVLAGLCELGAEVRAVGVLGNDEAGKVLHRRMIDAGADCDGLITLADRPTVTKTRLLGSSEDKSPQQMIRLDMEDASPVDASVAEKLVAAAVEAMDGAKIVALEDYNKGVLTPEVCTRIISAARERGLPVLVDPARLNATDYGKYAGATALKLNRPEAERASGMPARTPDQWKSAAESLLRKLDLEAIVLTLNDAGAYLATGDGVHELLTGRKRQVSDPTGAGDMVLVTLCLARAAGADWRDAVALANTAGGLEVEKLGCLPITRAEIIHDLMAEHHETSGKQRSLEQLLPELARHRAAGRKIVFTNGCFDLIHLGHVKYFQFAKAQGDLLVVAVNTDSSIRRLKGSKRPIISENDRVGVLEELESIDFLIRFDDDTPLRLIDAIRPEVLVKGADYAKETVVGWEIVEGCGGRIALAPLVDGRSTSAVVERILEAYR